MKTPARKIFLGAIVAIFFTLTFAALGQQPPAPAPAAPAANKSDDDDKPGLRRLDQPTEDHAAKHDEDEDGDEHVEKASDDEKAPPAPDAPPAPAKKPAHKMHSYGYLKNERSGDARVTIGGNSELGKGEHADAVVSVFGSSTSDGEVSDAVVSVLGSSTSSGNAGNAVVSILGNTRVTSGHVGDAAIAVLGDTYVNGQVGNAVVAVLGNVELGPNAEVGDVVSVGGTVHRDPKAIVHGQVQNVAVGVGIGHFSGLGWLHNWASHCLAYGRLLAFEPSVAWAWAVALAFLVFYAVIALIFHRGVEKCAETLEQRPGRSILSTVLTVLLTPVVFILLIVTVVGIALVPFLAAGLFIAKIFGKVVILAWLGRRVLSIGGGAPKGPATALAVLIGGAIVMLLYAVPIVGFIVYHAIGLLGLGVVVYTLLLANKRKQAAPVPLVPRTPPTTPAPSVIPLVPTEPVTPPPAAPLGVVTAPFVTSDVPPAAAAEPAAAEPPATPPPPVTPPPAATPAPAVPPPIYSAATLPRAGFWIRIAASAIDAMLVLIVWGQIPHVIRPNYWVLLAAYCVIMWALKSTTVGGIVCGLKVVRLDDRPVDWVTALVRALGGFISAFPAGLGYIWVSFDSHSQSWHDKIAGTTIVHVPRGASLV